MHCSERLYVHTRSQPAHCSLPSPVLVFKTANACLPEWLEGLGGGVWAGDRRGAVRAAAGKNCPSAARPLQQASATKVTWAEGSVPGMHKVTTASIQVGSGQWSLKAILQGADLGGCHCGISQHKSELLADWFQLALRTWV